MRNKAVELMVRCQFNIPETTEVSVRCLGRINDLYEYEIVPL